MFKFSHYALIAFFLLSACSSDRPVLAKKFDKQAAESKAKNKTPGSKEEDPDSPDSGEGDQEGEPGDSGEGQAEPGEDKPGKEGEPEVGEADPKPYSGRGVKPVWDEYEAESAKYKGQVLSATRDVGQHAAESSGRSSVKLSAMGDYVSVKAKSAGNSIVARVSVPDSADGKGLDFSLSVYVDGKKVGSLPLTSSYSWQYGDESHPSNNPGGVARKMFDEARLKLPDFAVGAEIKVQKDSGDNADFYVVDLIDLEKVPAALKKPADFLNVVDFGATPNDKTDDFEAFQKALKASTTQKKGLWIPEGKFWFERRLDNTGLNIQLEVEEQEVRGAGMWYSNLEGPGITFACTGSRCKYYNFAISGATNDRVDANRADNGFNDGSGEDSVLDGIWVEHVKVGYWVGKHHTKSKEGLKSKNLQIRNSRFRNLYADGVNFSNGTSNSIIENSHFRNTGDDAVAIWAQLNEGSNPDPNAVGNVFKNITVQLPWRANCFAFYGGKDTQLTNSTCSDTLNYPGILFSGEFSPHHPFEGLTTIKDVTLERAGGTFYANQFHGAIKLFSVNSIAVENILFENVDVIDPTYSGIMIEGQTVKNVTFKNVNVTGAGTDGVRLMASAQSAKVVFDNVKVTKSAKKAFENEPNKADAIVDPTGKAWVP